MTDERVLSDCRQLSSGTMATLTGQPNYARQDLIRLRFIAYVEAAQRHAAGCFNTWVDAWNAFWESDE